MTDFEKELLEQVRELRIALGSLIGQVNKNEGTLAALVKQVAAVEEKVDALPQVPAPTEKNLVRDGTMTLSGGAIAAIITAIVAHFGSK